MRAIFTYGTLALPVVLQTVTGRAFASERGWVTGLERFRVRDAVYPGVLATGKRSTDGRVYFGIDDETLAILDRFEDWLYERRSVDVVLLGGDRLAADAWVVPPRYASLLGRTPWDAERFARLDLADYLRGCRAFRRKDRSQNRG